MLDQSLVWDKMDNEVESHTRRLVAADWSLVNALLLLT